ncbi:hypothetical protein [Hymenobacter sp. IS2118]|uniref:hypothetical protein n=1 Tax=Hymenobacter sp. IS2118 TaxID=1505605 RepID=UPI00054E063D|nr:hypothetical protein [Hymenobacter sp. IS2118]
MAYSFIEPTLSASAVHALLAANRLETRPRSPEFNRALRAEIRDPTWLLARQWQLHEFRAEDRGTPAVAEVVVSEQPLSRLALPGQPSRAYAPAHQPLEAAVEAQPRVVGVGLRLQMGQYWLRQLRTIPALLSASPLERAAALAAFAAAYPLKAQLADEAPVAYAQEATTGEALALLQLAGATALDGYALYQALLAPHRTALLAVFGDSELLAQAVEGLSLTTGFPAAGPATALVGKTSLDTQARQFVLAFHRLYLLGEDSTSWSTEDMAYSFTVGTAGATGLGATHYPGGATLPWYAVDQRPAPAGTPAAPPAPVSQKFLPTEVQFPGAPAARWWEFEDRRVDFGQVTGDPSDWGRMLLQEFMFLYQNDWFSVPYAVPVGSVCAVQRLEVTDVFGYRYAIQPAGAGQLAEEETDVLIDNDATRWRLFAQTDPAHAGPAAAPQLYVPAAALTPLVSRPVEQVSFRREEATNVVWAVESIVSDGFAGGLDGASAAAQVAETLRRLVPAAVLVPAADPPAYTYQLASSVPENWLPFVPMFDNATGLTVLEQGVLPRQGVSLDQADPEAVVQPRTALLQLNPNAPYRLHEHEIPPSGVRVDGSCYRVRWYDGRTVLWFGRHRGPAQPGGSSGLAFDQLKPGPQ